MYAVECSSVWICLIRLSCGLKGEFRGASCQHDILDNIPPDPRAKRESARFLHGNVTGFPFPCFVLKKCVPKPSPFQQRGNLFHILEGGLSKNR